MLHLFNEGDPRRLAPAKRARQPMGGSRGIGCDRRFETAVPARPVDDGTRGKKPEQSLRPRRGFLSHQGWHMPRLAGVISARCCAHLQEATTLTTKTLTRERARDPVRLRLSAERLDADDPDFCFDARRGREADSVSHPGAVQGLTEWR